MSNTGVALVQASGRAPYSLSSLLLRDGCPAGFITMITRCPCCNAVVQNEPHPNGTHMSIRQYSHKGYDYIDSEYQVFFYHRACGASWSLASIWTEHDGSTTMRRMYALAV